MLRILPFPLVVLTAISLVFCMVTISLAFLNLKLVWANFIAGALTALYHLLVIILAWYRMSRIGDLNSDDETRKSKSGAGLQDKSRSPSTSIYPEYHAIVPFPRALITLGLIVVAVWIIAFGITTDIAVKGYNSPLVSTIHKERIDRTALVGSSLVLAVETATIMTFVWHCVKEQKRTSDQERDMLEDKWFYHSPMLGRSGSLRSLRRSYSRRSIRSTRRPRSYARTIEPPLPPEPVYLAPGTPAFTPTRHVSPWEMVTPRIHITRVQSLASLPPIPECGSPLLSLGRSPSSLAPTSPGPQAHV